MYWVNFLHIYQPSDQSKEILERVVNESYRPLFKGFLSLKNTKVNLNINGALTELLAKNNYYDVIEDIKTLAEKGRLEFTESAMYHPLLAFLSEDEIFRQVEKNRQINKKYFKEAYRPFCFFPPEMAYGPNVAKAIAKLNYPMILLDEISYNGGKNTAPNDRLFSIKNNKKILAVFRERRISNCIMSAIIRSKKEFKELVKEEIKEKSYFCTAMDGETFGHHRPGMEKNFFKILTADKPKQIFFSELPGLFSKIELISPVSATWASSKEDIDKGIQFYSWKNPKNEVHTLQWEFLNFIRKTSKNKKLTPSQKDKLDKAVSSDQFFWASGEPWWSIEMIEKGAWTMLETLKSLPEITEKEINRGEKYYKEIIALSFWWQRSGKIENLSKKYKETTKIPFRERTIEADKPEVYQAFITMMEKKMIEAQKTKNFEKAILWRDAIWKLETKNDIYDAIHAVDLLRMEVTDSELTKLMDRYKEKYKKLKPGQPEKRKA